MQVKGKEFLPLCILYIDISPHLILSIILTSLANQAIITEFYTSHPQLSFLENELRCWGQNHSLIPKHYRLEIFELDAIFRSNLASSMSLLFWTCCSPLDKTIQRCSEMCWCQTESITIPTMFSRVNVKIKSLGEPSPCESVHCVPLCTAGVFNNSLKPQQRNM